jgi:hypothetical protein
MKFNVFLFILLPFLGRKSLIIMYFHDYYLLFCIISLSESRIHINIGFEVPTALAMKNTIICSPTKVYGRLKGTYCFHHEGCRVSQGSK